jgi:hypothetical protein
VVVLSVLTRILFIFAVLGLELRAFTLSHSTSPFLQWIVFEIGTHGIIYLDWL